MLRIRLRREGAKSQPFYRIVVAEQDHPRDGRFVEVVGEYNPRTNPVYLKVNEARALHHLQNGAQPSEPVERILKTAGTLERLARLKKGEALEVLVAEADAAAASRSVSQKTRSDEGETPKGKSKKVKAKEAAAASS
jgi:small subunit ribosomal protein S16